MHRRCSGSNKRIGTDKANPHLLLPSASPAPRANSPIATRSFPCLDTRKTPGGLLMFLLRAAVAVLVAVTLSACVTTSMQGYADRELPARPVSRIVAYVAGPGPLVSSIQSSIRSEATKRGIEAADALLLFPPTRTYTDAEIRKGLAAHGIDGVLTINVGDTGVM